MYVHIFIYKLYIGYSTHTNNHKTYLKWNLKELNKDKSILFNLLLTKPISSPL